MSSPLGHALHYTCTVKSEAKQTVNEALTTTILRELFSIAFAMASFCFFPSTTLPPCLLLVNFLITQQTHNYYLSTQHHQHHVYKWISKQLPLLSATKST